MNERKKGRKSERERERERMSRKGEKREKTTWGFERRSHAGIYWYINYLLDVYTFALLYMICAIICFQFISCIDITCTYNIAQLSILSGL